MKKTKAYRLTNSWVQFVLLKYVFITDIARSLLIHIVLTHTLHFLAYDYPKYLQYSSLKVTHNLRVN